MHAPRQQEGTMLRTSILGLTLLLAACGDNTFDRTASGAGTGAATGAVIGAIAGPIGIGLGAAIGAGAGAVTGGGTSEKQLDLGKPVWKD